MKIDCLVLGDFQTNCYVLRKDRQSRRCLIIDPGMQSEPLVDMLRDNDLEPEAVLLTHGHIDHVAGVTLLRAEFPQVQLALHESDAEMLADPVSNLSLMTGSHFAADPAEILLKDGSRVEMADLSLEVLHTPGHTPGGVCFHCPDEKLVFTNDTLFAGGIGRSDFPKGDHRQLITAIREKLLTLPGETVVYPGHGPESTIEAEKRHNPFL